jgi:hypothetical protein
MSFRERHVTSETDELMTSHVQLDAATDCYETNVSTSKRWILPTDLQMPERTCSILLPALSSQLPYLSVTRGIGHEFRPWVAGPLLDTNLTLQTCRIPIPEARVMRIAEWVDADWLHGVCSETSTKILAYTSALRFRAVVMCNQNEQKYHTNHF